jgi:hypothetical protein
MSVRFLKPTYFIWLLILCGAYGTSQIVGLPHLRSFYDFRTAGSQFDPFAIRYYTRCTYWGPNGKFTIHFPANGECALFRFFTADSEYAEG